MRQNQRSWRISLLAAFFMMCLFLSLGHTPKATAQVSAPYSVETLMDGFKRTAFSSEFGGFGTSYVRKFNRTVRFHIRAVTPAARPKVVQVRRFIRTAARSIRNLNARFVKNPQDADFIVHITPRSLYSKIVKDKVYSRRSAPVRGLCMVRAQYSRAGITQSQAVIVFDEGERLFRRCMVEEILQGLGLLNDDASLINSIFNDRSNFTTFRRFDRLLLNILYDRRIKSGQNWRQVKPILRSVIEDVLRRTK